MPRCRAACLQVESLDARILPSQAAGTLAGFLAQQSTQGAPAGVYPLGWTQTLPSGARLFALVDFLGVSAQYLKARGVNLGTQVTGHVTQAPTRGGFLDTVEIDTTRALTWVAGFAGGNTNAAQFTRSPLLIGQRVGQLAAYPQLQPTLTTAHLTVVFFAHSANATLPDLATVFVHHQMPAGIMPVSISFRDNGFGTLDQRLGPGAAGSAASIDISQVATNRSARFNEQLVTVFPLEVSTPANGYPAFLPIDHG